MRLPTLSLVSAFAISLASTGCFWATTKSEGEAIRRDVKTLQEGQGMKQKELDAQIAQLKSVLDDATKLLKRNSADLGADVDALRSDVNQAKGLATQISNQIAELRAAHEAYKKQHDARLDSLEQRIGQLESGKPSANSSPEDLWKLGATAFEAGRYNDAVEIFKRLHTSFPTHDRADDAIYFKGQAYTNLKDWEKAIGSYQQLSDKFPTGPLTDDGLYFAAIAAQNLKQCGEARAYLAILKQKHPKSNVAKQATALDTQLKKDAKNKSKCSA